ncbi:MAG: Fis family transcriptional regulator [Candidatus Sedimenticola endophacoides]|uniref:Putative Fis-like DNA-binding protein n=1 Tax=Candidatus Sedimenticola endophacoides TaxID=2548426 RepID=A0A657Q2I6_9GAMM|nr:MAG: Fis family transcriptional regulator [Candidatus Sedimenticola endophacoides]OQX35889.1 MAG: Fis family transcriptional regulator [Candidatus Sedimenticola endophacoides]OQX37316.1 MAG: Fis family transcriptional regulator [Candidatus Sedimenticola endophacoides]OQX41271.1 MAG: Fis family transcriptional regulator [Candidatus Sedimenticola endophacoides]OQX42554.1 MAG: Fis family transcriptional regulator [Candidatus Sedimenticola endophacoides]
MRGEVSAVQGVRTAEFAVTKKRTTEPLSECVRDALNSYFRQLDGHAAADLYQMVISEVELPLLETVMEHTRGNQTKAAALLGISRSTLRKKLATHGLD